MTTETNWSDFADSDLAKEIINALQKCEIMNFNKTIPGEMLTAELYNKMNDMLINACNTAGANVHLLKEYILQFLPNKVIIDTGLTQEAVSIIDGQLLLHVPSMEYIDKALEKHVENTVTIFLSQVGDYVEIDEVELVAAVTNALNSL